MANQDSPIPDGQEPVEPESQSVSRSDYLNDPELTARAFDEIVSELLNLSTNSADDETALTEKDEQELIFPRAPWVDSPGWTASNSDINAFQRGKNNPRGWNSDDDILDSLDSFTQPDPPFELSTDPIRNLGWFLAILGVVGFLVTYLFTGLTLKLALIVFASAIICGIWLLIWRIPIERSALDNGNGAQV